MRTLRRISLVVCSVAALVAAKGTSPLVAEEQSGNCIDCVQANIAWWGNCNSNGGQNCNSEACWSLKTNCDDYCHFTPGMPCPFY